MCGRYVNVSKIKAIEKRFNAQMKQPELYRVNTNISVGELAPVITQDKPSDIQFLSFGFSPSWAKKQFYQINARSEGDHNRENNPSYSGPKGILQKPMFRQSIRSKRCLVLADAFIEGPEKEKLSKPFLVYMKDGKRPFAMAGIYDDWVNQETGEITSSFAVITTTANDLLQHVGHHRSPVILEKGEETEWLNSSTPLGEITSLLKPYPDEMLNAYPISPAIKSPRANGTELLQPTGERVFTEYDYEIYSDIKLFGMGERRARKRRKGEDDQLSIFD
ncbi:MAG: SOS response-associated peptidase, partial [Flavobacteriales bacterium]